jgi:hypothetical protein
VLCWIRIVVGCLFVFDLVVIEHIVVVGGGAGADDGIFFKLFIFLVSI